MSVEDRKKALRRFYEPVADKLGYKITPNEEEADFLLTQEAELEKLKGVPFCPCKAMVKDRSENMKNVCPCIPFHQEHFNAMRRCWCGLFVHKDVTDPSALKQIPPSKFRKPQ